MFKHVNYLLINLLYFIFHKICRLTSICKRNGQNSLSSTFTRCSSKRTLYATIRTSSNLSANWRRPSSSGIWPIRPLRATWLATWRPAKSNRFGVSLKKNWRKCISMIQVGNNSDYSSDSLKYYFWSYNLQITVLERFPNSKPDKNVLFSNFDMHLEIYKNGVCSKPFGTCLRFSCLHAGLISILCLKKKTF